MRCGIAIWVDSNVETRGSLVPVIRIPDFGDCTQVYQAKLSALPAVASADPQAATAAEMVAWLSAGTFNPAPSDVARLRALGLALAPSLAGLIMMLAMSLARRG